MRNKEKAKLWRKEYAAKNREKINAKMKEYRDANKDKFIEYSKKSRNKNKERYNALRRKWYKENPERRRNYHLKAKYKITLDQYNSLLNLQFNKCAICKIASIIYKKNFSVDHDHKTGVIRGLLCDDCNHLLGQAKDNIETCNNAASYLEKAAWEQLCKR